MNRYPIMLGNKEFVLHMEEVSIGDFIKMASIQEIEPAAEREKFFVYYINKILGDQADKIPLYYLPYVITRSMELFMSVLNRNVASDDVNREVDELIEIKNRKK